MNGRWIRRIWQPQGTLGILVWSLFLPAAWLYWLAVEIRSASYAFGWRKPRRLNEFVISIGNLTVGGTGKTPTVIWMAQELQKRGFGIAVLSRGYNRKGNQPRIVNPSLSADVEDFGDEPAMMARLFGLTVAVANPRYQGADKVTENSAVDVFLLDDGFQHLQLARDVDLLLLGTDADGWMLPCGPFREPTTALHRADFLLITGARERWQQLTAKNPPGSVFYGGLQPQALIAWESRHWREHSLTRLARQKILAVSAIANSEPLYRMIESSKGNIVDVLEFPDHHKYSVQDGKRIAQAARNADLIVTTEKDILKLIRFPFAEEKLLALRVAMIVENGGSLVQAIVERIHEKQSRHPVRG